MELAVLLQIHALILTVDQLYQFKELLLEFQMGSVIQTLIRALHQHR